MCIKADKLSLLFFAGFELADAKSAVSPARKPARLLYRRDNDKCKLRQQHKLGQQGKIFEDKVVTDGRISKFGKRNDSSRTGKCADGWP